MNTTSVMLINVLMPMLYMPDRRNGMVVVNLVAQKYRMTPMGPLSIPRLDLCAAVLLAQLIAMTHRT